MLYRLLSESMQPNYKRPRVKSSRPLCVTSPKLIYIQRGLREIKNCSSGVKIAAFFVMFAELLFAFEAGWRGGGGRSCEALSVLFSSQNIPRNVSGSQRHTFLGRERALIPFSPDACVLHKAPSVVSTAERDFQSVCLLKPLFTPHRFPCHLAISRTHVVGVKPLEFKERVAH